jgi:YD repeat-containing protein
MQPKLFIGTAILAVLSATSLGATNYSYDNLGRLWVVTYDNGMQVTYTYDSAGNRTSVVTQTGTNRPPQINNDYVTVNENGTITFNPLTIDTDPNGYTLSITGIGSSSLTGSQAPTTLSHTSNSITYTPASSYLGKDYFTYAVTNSHGGSGSATVYMTVGTPGPIAKADNVTTPENTPANYDPRTNDIEPNPPGYSLTITSTTTPSHGTVVINSGTSLTYTPTTGYTGSDSFSYTISDSHGSTSTAVDTVNIGPPPVAVAVYASTTATNTPTTFDPRVNDSDPGNLALTVTGVATPAHGTVSIVNNGTQVTYTPASGYSGLDTFNYTITDTAGLSATAAANVCVAYAAPVAANGSVLVHKLLNGGGFVPTSTSDPASTATVSCGQAPTIIGVSQGAHGSVTLNSGSSVTWVYYTTVNTTIQQDGIDTFTYTITDPFGGTATGTVTVDFNITQLGG